MAETKVVNKEATLRKPWKIKVKMSLDKVVFAGLCLLLFYPPYFRGLFFTKEMFYTHLFTIVLFLFCWLAKLRRKDAGFLKTPFDYTAFAFVLIYILAIPGAANFHLAVTAALKVANYFAVFWLVSQIVKDLRGIETILKVVLLSAFGVALAGVAAATGIVKLTGAFEGGRIFGTLQYPNALASYLTAALMVGLALWIRSEKKWERSVYAGICFTLFLVFIFTYSRGGWLLFPVILLFFFFGLPKDCRTELAINFLVLFAVSLICIKGFGGAVASQAAGSAWAWLAAGAVLTAGAEFSVHYFSKRIAKKKIVLGIAVTVVLVALAGSFAFLQSGGMEKLLPQNLLTRLGSISLQERNLQERLAWDQDAFKMMLQKPLQGFGGGGWEAAYLKYQSYHYYTTQVHNHFLQVGVETGLVGFLIYLGIWGAFLHTAWKLRGKLSASSQGTLLWGMAAGALGLGLHSAIDFNLSLGAVSILLWAMFGLARGMQNLVLDKDEERIAKRAKKGMASYYAAAIASSILIGVFVLALVLGDYYNDVGRNALVNGDLATAETALRRAVSLEPFNAGFHNDLSACYAQQAVVSKQKDSLTKVYTELKKAVELSPYDVNLRIKFANFAYKYHSREEGVQNFEIAKDLQPFNPMHYENLSSIYMGYAMYNLDKGDANLAKEYLQKTADLVEKISQQNQKQSPKVQTVKNLLQQAPLQVTPLISLHVGEANYLLRDYAKAEQYLQGALAQQDLSADAYMFLALTYEKTGEQGKALEALGMALKIDPGIQERYQAMKALPPV